jgi:uncharacterized membrane protein YphA (DoxX/SURF4 family)
MTDATIGDLAVRTRGRLVAWSPAPATLARLGLGAMVLLAGIHKLADPTAWTVYVVGWLEPLIVVTPREFMLLNGVLEVGFGALILADRYTAVSAAVAAVSLTATVGYLVVAGLTQGAFWDVVIRDVGLAGLAWAVLADAVRESAASAGNEGRR